MIIRETPKNLEKYYKFEDEFSKYLQFEGFFPTHMDMNYLYFEKTEELERHLRMVGKNE